MHVAIACLERELETLTHNHAITAVELAAGKPTWLEDAEEQQALRQAHIDGLKVGLERLRAL